MHHFHPQFHHLYHYFRSKDLDELYISVALKSLAESLISIFVPIYLLTLGYGIPELALYYLVFYTSVAVFMPLCMYLNAKIGMKKIMATGIAVLIGYYWLLNSIGQGIPYYLVALSFGISVALYFSAFHLEFTKFSDNKEEATEFSILRIISIVATILGPFLGALFISNTSFTTLFIIVSFLLAGSAAPLFFSKDRKIPKPQFTIKKIFKADNTRKAIAYQASGILGIASSIFWPVFIYFTITEIFSIGVIISLTSLISVFFLFYIGRITDKHKNRILKVGIFSHSISWIGRLFLLSPIGVFIANFYSSISGMLIDIPFTKMIYDNANTTKNLADYFLFREFHLEFGRIIILVIAYFTGSIEWIFIIAFLATFVHFSLLKHNWFSTKII